MRILILSAYYFPEQVASTYLMTSLNEHLASNGYNVKFITPKPSRNVNSVNSKSKHKEVLFEGKLTIKRIWLPKEHNNKILRALRYLLMNFKYFFIGLFSKADVLFSMSTPPTQGILIGLLSKLKRIKSVYNIQDVFPDSLLHSGLTSKNSIIFKLGKYIEKKTYKYNDKLILISTDMEKNLRIRINNKSKIHVISNWVDINHFTYVSRLENLLFNKYSIDASKFIFLYAGSLGEAQNIDLIIESAEKSKHLDDVLFLIFGFGNKVNELSSLILEKKMTNILVFPAEPYENANLVYSMADVGIVTCKKGFGQTSLPSKTMSILSTGCPILASFDNNTELEDIIIKNKLGVFTSSDDTDSFIKSIESLYSNRELVQQFKRNTRDFAVENFSPDIQIKKYIRIFEDLRR